MRDCLYPMWQCQLFYVYISKLQNPHIALKPVKIEKTWSTERTLYVSSPQPSLPYFWALSLPPFSLTNLCLAHSLTLLLSVKYGEMLKFWCCYITVDFATTASQNGVCISQEKCQIMIFVVNFSMIKDKSNKKCNVFVMIWILLVCLGRECLQVQNLYRDAVVAESTVL